MRAIEKIKASWQEEMQRVDTLPWFQRLNGGELNLKHYISFLRETYFNARENPQLQAYATAYFTGTQRKLVKKFYQHAISEIGHDQLALDDMAALGVDVTNVPNERPLATTIGFTAYGFYQVQFLNVLGYLGYLFHLEFMPTQNGDRYMKRLSSLGVPTTAMTFLEEHTKVDIAHNKLMEGYVEQLVTTDEAIEEVCWAARTACILHSHMVCGALEAAEGR